MPSHKTIAIFPPPDDPRVVRLLKCLAGAFEIEFCPITTLDQLQHDAVLLLADDDAAQLKALASFPAVFSSPGLSGSAVRLAGEARFAQHGTLAAPFLGQTFTCALDTRVCVAELPGFAPSLSVGGIPVWTVSPARLHYRVNISIGGLAENEEVIDALHEYAFVSVLPLVDFIRRVSEGESWIRPDLRAALIIDDPNLHSRGYGYIDYEKLACHARQIGFHTCMATVPFDGWFVNSQAVKLFKKYADVLSLAAHGNDHEHRELAQKVSAQGANGVIAHAVSRLAGIEEKSGLPIARAMIPPHGVCSQTYLDAMFGAGFYGVTTTRTAIWEHISRNHRSLGSGMGPAELVGGFPIIHRFRFNSDRWRHRIAVSAYLRHPLIAHGHHEDFATGHEAFDAVASRINELGARWGNLTELFSSNFETRRLGDSLAIRPYSTHLAVNSDLQYTTAILDLGKFADSPPAAFRYSLDGAPEIRQPCSDSIASIPLAGARRLTLTLEPAGRNDALKAPRRRTRLASAVRRVMSEGRDRATVFRQLTGFRPQSQS